MIASFKPAPQTPSLVLLFWCPQDLAQVTPPWRFFLITQSPSPCPSKNYSPSHSQNHTLILYCSQIYVNLLSTRLLAASQGQDYALDFGNASRWFLQCLPNGRVMSTVPGVGSRKTVLWDLGECCLVSIRSDGGHYGEAAI